MLHLIARILVHEEEHHGSDDGVRQGIVDLLLEVGIASAATGAVNGLTVSEAALVREHLGVSETHVAVEVCNEAGHLAEDVDAKVWLSTAHFLFTF